MALTAVRDQDHRAAVKCFHALEEERGHRITTDYIIDETLTLLRRHGFPITRIAEFYNKLRLTAEGPSLDLMFVGDGIFSESWDLFRSYGDQGVSFTDCTSLADARTLSVAAVFSFDRHFEIGGSDRIPRQ